MVEGVTLQDHLSITEGKKNCGEMYGTQFAVILLHIPGHGGSR